MFLSKEYFKSVDGNKNYELQDKNKAINDIYIYTIMCNKNKYY